MNEQTAAALARRLAAYSASAGIALACAPEAGAQVVYHDFDPDIVLTSGPVYFDFDEDGTVDLWGFLSRSYTAYDMYIAFYRPPAASPLNGALGDENVHCCEGDGPVSRLSSGDVIGPVRWPLSFLEEGILARAGCPFCTEPPFQNQEGYAGFRFVAADGEPHYGWIRLHVVNSDFFGARVDFLEYAYEETPGVPIRAGALTRLGLAGAVNQTQFPPAGGTLRYGFALTTTNASPLALWAVAEDEGGAIVLDRSLWTGVLPAGGTATDTVAVPIPPDLPAGTYAVTYYAGLPDRSITLAEETFKVTKAVGTAAEPGGPEPSATHALSGASPNPSGGPARLTLAVSRTQAVRLTIHDALGRAVATLHDGALTAGTAHAFSFDGTALPAGVYVVRAVGEDFADTRILTLAR